MEYSPAWGMSPFTVDGAGKTKCLLRDVEIASSAPRGSLLASARPAVFTADAR